MENTSAWLEPVVDSKHTATLNSGSFQLFCSKNPAGFCDVHKSAAPPKVTTVREVGNEAEAGVGVAKENIVVPPICNRTPPRGMRIASPRLLAFAAHSITTRSPTAIETPKTGPLPSNCHRRARTHCVKEGMGPMKPESVLCPVGGDRAPRLDQLLLSCSPRALHAVWLASVGRHCITAPGVRTTEAPSQPREAKERTSKSSKGRVMEAGPAASQSHSHALPKPPALDL